MAQKSTKMNTASHISTHFTDAERADLTLNWPFCISGSHTETFSTERVVLKSAGGEILVS